MAYRKTAVEQKNPQNLPVPTLERLENDTYRLTFRFFQKIIDYDNPINKAFSAKPVFNMHVGAIYSVDFKAKNSKVILEIIKSLRSKSEIETIAARTIIKALSDASENQQTPACSQ